jgi:hypothetical protein
MRLQLVVTFALVSSAFAQRNLNPIRTNGNMPRSVIPLTAGARAFGPGLIPLPNPGALPPGSRFGPGRINGSRFYAAYGAAYDPIYDADASFDGFYADHGDGFDGFYSDLSPDAYAPYQTQPEVPTPSVVINEAFRTDTIHPQLRDYSNVKLPEPGTVVVPPSAATAAPTQPALQSAPALADDRPIIFLIALQDHVILPAVAYWVEGNTLHYISLDGAPHQVSLGLIDRDFSKQLNRERNLPFALPAANPN